LADDRPGNTTQSIGLARALGWPYEVKTLQFTPLARWIKKLLGPFAATDKALDRAHSSRLDPPWPDLAIAAGWRPAQIARWLKRQSRGRTRIVQLGRKGGHVAGLFDAVVSCSYFQLPPHPRRIMVAAPLTQVSPERLAEAAAWRTVEVGQAPHPYVVVLVGGATKRHRWNAESARRLGEDVCAFTREIGGSLFVVTSRRTGDEAAAALKHVVQGQGRVHEWQPNQQDNPYFAYLALADAFVVTGESESMLAEAAATGKPLFIYPLPTLPLKPKARRKDAVVRHAYLQQDSPQGTVSWPQRIVGKICRGLLAAGLVRPRRNLHELHQALIRRGVAHFFRESFQPEEHPPLREVDEVARRVRQLFGYEGDAV
jgi:hypothetical protein